jgi:hypothetical protein
MAYPVDMSLIHVTTDVHPLGHIVDSFVCLQSRIAKAATTSVTQCRIARLILISARYVHKSNRGTLQDSVNFLNAPHRLA